MPNKKLILKEETTRENRIWVRIAAACNVKCVFCLDADAQNGKLIDDSEIRNKIREWYKKWMKNRIIISGWEASIHPKFDEYIRYAKEVWYDIVQTVTNGNRFSDLSFCKKVCDAWLGEITFSIHGHTATLHDYLTAAPGSYQKIIRWLLNIKKYYPNIVVNIDVVVNKLNVDYLPQMIRFFMKLGVYEFDILQIIPFGRWFKEYKDILFYQIDEHISSLHQTWNIAQLPGVNMWTNRFPVEAFEWYEDLIQDPRKIKSETMGIEWYDMFDSLVKTNWKVKPSCYGTACDVCFLNQFCHDYIKYPERKLENRNKYLIWIDGFSPNKHDTHIILRWCEFPSDVYRMYWENKEDFLEIINKISLNDQQKLVNIPKCLRSDHNDGLYEWNSDLEWEKSVEQYTKNYIMNLYRKKSLRCKTCIHNASCEWIHINFIRSYWFEILKPIEE